MHPPEDEWEAEVDGELSELLGALDDPAPSVSAEDVIRAAEARPGPARKIPHAALWAASLAGLTAAGIVVAAIVPGSPLREAIERIGADPVVPAAEDAASDLWSRQSGVALVAGREIEIRFETTQSQGSIELVAVGGDSVRVEVRDDAVGFIVGGGSIRIQNRAAAASYRISLPEQLPAARITVGPDTIYRRIGGEVVRDAFQPDGGFAFTEP